MRKADTHVRNRCDRAPAANVTCIPVSLERGSSFNSVMMAQSGEELKLVDGGEFSAHTGRRHLPDLLFDYLLLPVAGQHQFPVALNRRHLIPVVSATGLIGHLAVEILLNLSHRDISVAIAISPPVGSAAESR